MADKTLASTAAQIDDAVTKRHAAVTVTDGATIGFTLTGQALTGEVKENTSNQKVAVAKAGTAVGTRKAINLIEGSNVTLTVADDVENDRVNVTVGASGGGGGGVTDITYADLVTLVGSGGLTPGGVYRITDFATRHYIVDGDGVRYSGEGNEITGVIEPLLVLATSENTLSHEAKSALYPQDIIHYDWNPANWMNDVSFADAESEPATAIITGFKGVITFRHDTMLDNSCGYDFRNVRFRRWKTNATAWDSGTTYPKWAQCTDGAFIYYSTKDENINNGLSTVAWQSVIDLSYTEYWFNVPQGESTYADLHTFHACNEESLYELSARNNHIVSSKDDYNADIVNGSLLNNNVFHLDLLNNWLTEANIIGSDSGANTVGANFANNTIGAGFGQNIIGSNFHDNTIGSYFSNNTIGAGFNNIIGSDFLDNTIGGGFANNTIGAGFGQNIIGSNFHDNTIGINFNRNTVENEFGQNIVRSGFYHNTIGFNFNHNTVESGISDSTGGIDFTGATHVYGAYNCTIYVRPDETAKLRYYNNSDTLVVVAPDA